MLVNQEHAVSIAQKFFDNIYLGPIELFKAYTKMLSWEATEVVKMDLETSKAQLRVYESCECEMCRGATL